MTLLQLGAQGHRFAFVTALGVMRLWDSGLEPITAQAHFNAISADNHIAFVLRAIFQVDPSGFGVTPSNPAAEMESRWVANTFTPEREPLQLVVKVHTMAE